MWIITRDVVWEGHAVDFDWGLDSAPSRAGRFGYDGKSYVVIKTTEDYASFKQAFDEKLNDLGRKRKAVRIRAFDDDNNLYYECIATSADDADAFFDWAMGNAGATYTMYEDFRGHWRYLHG